MVGEFAIAFIGHTGGTMHRNITTRLLAVVSAALFALPLSAIAAKNVLIVNGASTTSETGTTADITANLQALQVAAGNTVTVADTPPASLAGYTEVWDIRFSNSSPLTAGDQTLYQAFLASGKSMFIMGENSGFMTRNDSVNAFIATMGGGTLAFATPSQPQTVNPPFTGPNPVTSISYSAPGGSSTPGTGAFATNNGPNGTAIAWGPGKLSGAPGAAVVVVYDVNFMQVGATTNETNFLKNLIGYINAGGGGAAVSVPTLSEWSLLVLAVLLGGAAMLYLRRRNV
jgi:hypothetical protein